MDGTMMCTVCGRTDQPYSNRQLKRMRTGGAVAVCIDCCTAKQAARSVGKSARLEAASVASFYARSPFRDNYKALPPERFAPLGSRNLHF